MVKLRAIVAACALAVAAACNGSQLGGVVPEGVGRGALAPDLAPRSGHFGDVVTVKPGGGYKTLAWDPFDRILIGANGSYYSSGIAPAVILGTSKAFALPQNATGVAFDPTTKTFYFSFQHSLYASRAGSAVSTETTSIGQAGSLAVDSSGGVYIIDNDHIDKFKNGKLTVYALPGVVTTGYSGQYAPPSLAFDSNNKALYLTDTGGDAVKRILSNGAAVVIAGHCSSYRSTCTSGNVPGKGKAVLLGAPTGIAYDPHGNDLIVADSWNNQLWRIAADGSAAPVAGYGPSGDYDGNGWHAFFSNPVALASAPELGAIFVSDGPRVAKYLVTGPSPAPQASPTLRFSSADTPSSISAPAVGGSTAWFVTPGVLHSITASGEAKSYKKSDLGQYVAVDKAGNVWVDTFDFAKNNAGLARFDASRTFTGFPIAFGQIPQINGLIVGPDGNPWFTDGDALNPAIGTVVSSAVVMHALPKPSSGFPPRPTFLANGPDGSIWFVDGGNGFQRMATDGSLLSPVALRVRSGEMVRNAKTGDVWFLDGDGRPKVYRLTRNGQLASFNVGCTGCSDGLSSLTVTPDDTAWIADDNPAGIIAITSDGKKRGYYLPLVNAGPSGIAARSDRAIWITSYSGQVFLFDPEQYARAHLPYNGSILPSTRFQALP